MEYDNEIELLEKVEKAAEKGARRGSKKAGMPSLIITIICVILIAAIIAPKIIGLSNTFDNIFSLEEGVEGKDLTIANHGFFGYKAVDFADAVLGDAQKLKKIEVYEQEISDAATIEDTGLFNLSVFSKSKIIKYTGTVVYTVDLSVLTSDCIELDEESATVIMHIQHPRQEQINIPEDKIEIGDTEKGLLAFGKLNVSIEENQKIQAGVRAKMEDRLKQSDILDTADRFARMVIWEMYTPIIKSVASNYSLEVVVDR
ncbi:MAG: DUF4230 domain-containing protein [Bacillota bacterium]|nr:DUF4230 domain-containing protein [Bacillota bacterium]